MANIIADGHEFAPETAWERIKDGPLTELAFACDVMARGGTGPTSQSYARLADEIRTLIQLRHGEDRMYELRNEGTQP